MSDLRGLLANKDLDVVPEIKLLRQRLDDGIHSARESAIRAAQDAAAKPRTQRLLPTATPMTNLGAWPVPPWPLAPSWVFAGPPLKRGGFHSSDLQHAMELAGFVGLDVIVARWRVAAIEGAIAVEDRMELASWSGKTRNATSGAYWCWPWRWLD